MKFRFLLYFLIAAIVVTGAGITFYPKSSSWTKKSLARTSEHPERPLDGIREYAEYEFNLLKNPETGTIPAGTFETEWQQALATEKVNNINGHNPFAKTGSFGSWSFKGPSNLGGRTRAIGIDVANNDVILAGNVSGGISRTTNGGSSWTNVTPSGSIKNITSIAQDTRSGQTSTWYFCTGEGIGNSVSGNAGGAFYLGNGVYKSTDNGVSWSRLANSNAGSDETFDEARDLCWRIAVDPTNGDVYLAATNAIYRSTNGGTSWSSVLSGTLANSGQATDVVITSTGTIYAAFSGAAGSGVDGVWRSTDGTTWTHISGLISGSQVPSAWNTAGAYGRVVLAIAPSAETTVYTLYYNNVNSNCTTPAAEAELFRYDSTSNAWTNLSGNLPNETGCSVGNDPFAVQQGYDLCIAVKPDDANTVFIGGTNVYRSTNGFSNTSTTARIGGYANTSGYSMYTNHHPDIHELRFGSASDDLLYTGDDGGIQKSDITATTPSWTSLNNNYPSYQYYHVALDPTAGSTLALGGAQDNGTTYMDNGSTVGNFYFSGDGASVGMDANGTRFYFSTQNGAVYRDYPSFVSIQPATNKSLFVTNFLLDPDNNEYMYFANGNDLYRTASASTVTTSSGWTLLSGLATAVTSSNKIYAIATSRGTYSTNTSSQASLSRLYVGTDGGKLFRLDDPQNVAASTTPADITPTGMSSGTLVSVAVDPADSRKLMAVYSNYGVNSVWYTSDASVASPTWSNVEGNISALSFRSVVILSNGTLTDYVVGTSKGIYSTTTLNGSSTIWNQEASTTIGYVPVLDLEYRKSDQTLLAGTHGNGMFITTNFPLPVNFISFDAFQSSSNKVSLRWDVAGAENVKEYIIQRSSDGINWKRVTSVASKGGSGNSTYTSSDHVNDNPTKIYYRIRAEEKDGDGNYSTIASVQFLKTVATTVASLYPTVVDRYLTIESAVEGNLAVLFDMQGKSIASVSLNAGKNIKDLSVLPAGQYLVSIYSKGQLAQSSKIIKQ